MLLAIKKLCLIPSVEQQWKSNLYR